MYSNGSLASVGMVDRCNWSKTWFVMFSILIKQFEANFHCFLTMREILTALGTCHECLHVLCTSWHLAIIDFCMDNNTGQTDCFTPWHVHGVTIHVFLSMKCLRENLHLTWNKILKQIVTSNRWHRVAPSCHSVMMVPMERTPWRWATLVHVGGGRVMKWWLK